MPLGRENGERENAPLMPGRGIAVLLKFSLHAFSLACDAQLCKWQSCILIPPATQANGIDL